jgi:hypothetical protein
MLDRSYHRLSHYRPERGAPAAPPVPAFTAPSRIPGITLLAVLALGALAPASSLAQGAKVSGTIARTFEIEVREGLGTQFADGYRRHLDWHTRAGDPWAWYMWRVSNGERAGLYVDGTFGHAWSDFDSAVDPPGDGADNVVNVDPFTTRAANHVWRLRPELGGLQVDPEAAPMVLRTEYRMGSGAREEFDDALRRLRGVAGDRPYAVFELVSGGEPPTYVLWVPVATWSDAGDFAERASEIMRALAARAESTRSELWQFRPDLSICRSSKSKCHGTVP